MVRACLTFSRARSFLRPNTSKRLLRKLIRIPPSWSFLEYHCYYPLFQDKKKSKRDESDEDSGEEVLFFTAE